MVSDKRSGARGGPGATRGPRLFGTRPGSVNRGFASVDPERQREPDVESGGAAVEGPAISGNRGGRAPASAPAAQPRSTRRRGRGEPGAEDEGGSA